MADGEFFKKMRHGAWFFNSCRGEVMDEQAFLAAKECGKIGGALIDVWPGEPDISDEMLSAVELGTPHIAGYSADGKANGTAAAVRFISGKLGITGLQNWRPSGLPAAVFPEIIDLSGINDVEEALKKAVLHAYDIRQDAEKFRQEPENFENLRGSYWVRREFPAYKVVNAPPAAKEPLLKLGFQVI
jgi:erythronate-4-phosphate dehydrogenase